MSDQKPFGDLTPSELSDWMTRDPDTYWPAAHAWAREAAERDMEQARRRQAREDRERLLRPLRRLWTAARNTFGGTG